MGVGTGVGVGVQVGVGVGWLLIVTYSVSSTLLLAEATSFTQALPVEQAFSPRDVPAVVTSRLTAELDELQEELESSQWELILNLVFVPDGDTLLAVHVMDWFTCMEDREHVRSPLTTGVGTSVGVGVQVGVGVGTLIVTCSVSSTTLVAETNSFTQALPDLQARSRMDTGAVAAAVVSWLNDELGELQE